MIAGQGWTGREATALREAMHMTPGRFAARLGVSPRTVTSWAAHPALIPRAAVQDLLDEMLATVGPGPRARFGQLATAGGTQLAGHAEALRVAIAIVIHGGDVLLVKRRADGTGIGWGFPAGIVKPGAAPAEAAERETLAETGVHCTVTGPIGSRLHPVTAVWCDYFRCAYLAGEPANLDPSENAAVAWAPRRGIGTFIELSSIYAPVLGILEEQRDAALR